MFENQETFAEGSRYALRLSDSLLVTQPTFMARNLTMSEATQSLLTKHALSSGPKVAFSRSHDLEHNSVRGERYHFA